MKNLVLFWGWSTTEKSYNGLIKSAPKNWKVYHASYPKLIPSGRLDKLQENILKFLERNHLSRTNILGHSLGGALALEFTRHHPNKVERLYLIDSEGVYDGKSLLNALWNVTVHSGSISGNTKENLRALFRVLRSPILHARLGHFAHHVDLQEEAKEIKVPTTIIWGKNDHIIPLWQGKRLHNLISHSKLIILENMGHNWILEHPELFWENI